MAAGPKHLTESENMYTLALRARHNHTFSLSPSMSAARLAPYSDVSLLRVKFFSASIGLMLFSSISRML